MARNKHASSIRSELAKLSNPLPTSADPEDFLDGKPVVFKCNFILILGFILPER
jgi:hypothetical protein